MVACRFEIGVLKSTWAKPVEIRTILAEHLENLFQNP
jgi:hypothetical protein